MINECMYNLLILVELVIICFFINIYWFVRYMLSNCVILISLCFICDGKKLLPNPNN